MFVGSFMHFQRTSAITTQNYAL